MSYVIKVLRKIHPEKEWYCERAGFGWHYFTSDGWEGHFCSCLVSTYPDDIDGHATDRFYIYKPNEPTEEVFQLNRNKIYSI
jgi:hypothetical protein